MAEFQKIVPNLWFDGNAKDAADFYVSVFKDGKIVDTTFYPTEGLEDFQKPLAGKELTVTYELCGQQFVAINAGPEFKFTEAVSFAVMCDDQAEIDDLWGKLSSNPANEQCGWCKDKFGLSWQIVPKDMDNLMRDESGQYKQAAFNAMMQMKKIVIADLVAAANQS